MTARSVTKMGLALTLSSAASGCFVSLDDLEGVSQPSGTGGSTLPGDGDVGDGDVTIGDGDQPAGVGGTATGGTGGDASSGGTTATGGADATGGTGGEPGPTYGPNLIDNGDFSAEPPAAGWDNGGDGEPPTDGGFGCTSSLMDKEHSFLGWSGGTDGLTLEAGNYVLEFRMIARDADEVNIKIARNVDPYTPEVFNQTLFDVGTLDSTYSYSFPVGSTQTQMGLLFSAQNKVGQVCVDNVTLRRIEE